MPLELICRCDQPHAVTRDDLLRLLPAAYRLCPECRETVCNAPRVPATAVWSERSRIWTLTIRCPHCGTRHYHGGGDGPEPAYGHRLSHCRDRTNPGYILVAVTSAEDAA